MDKTVKPIGSYRLVQDRVWGMAEGRGRADSGQQLQHLGRAVAARQGMGKTEPGQKQGSADQQAIRSLAKTFSDLKSFPSPCTTKSGGNFALPQGSAAVLHSCIIPARNLPHGGPHHRHVTLGARQSSKPQLGLITITSWAGYLFDILIRAHTQCPCGCIMWASKFWLDGRL